MATLQADLVLDLSQAQSEIEQLASDIDAATQNVEVTVDVAAATDQVQADIESLEASPIDVDVAANVDEAQAEVNSIDAEPVEIPVEVPAGAQAEVDGLTDSVEGLSGAVEGFAAVGLGAALVGVVGAFAESELVFSRVEQNISTFGGQAVVSTAHVQDLATEIQRYSGVSDETIGSGAALLLTFENIGNSALTTEENFDRATRALVDLAASGYGTVESNAISLGRALENPVQGMQRLARQGVTFTDAEKELAASLEATGDVAGAQDVVLSALERRYQGAAEAAGGTLVGSLNRAKEAFGDFGEVVGASVAVFIDPVIAGVASMAESFFELDPAVQSTIGGLVALTLAGGTAAASAVALKAAIGSELVASLKTAAVELRALAASSQLFALASNPVVAVVAFAAIGAGILIASGQADELKASLVGLGGSLSTLSEPIIPALVAAFDGLNVALAASTGAADAVASLTDELAGIVEVVPGIEDGSGVVQGFFEVATKAALASIPGLGSALQLLDAIGDLTGLGNDPAKGISDLADASDKLDPEVIAAEDAALSSLAATLPTVASGFDELQGADPAALDEFFGTVNAASDPAVLSANLQAQADALNAFSANLSIVAEQGPADLAANLQALGPEAATLTAEIAAALESGDLTEAARLSGAISNLEDAKNRFTGLGSEAGQGFSDSAQATIDTGGQAIAAASDAVGSNAAAGLAAGFGVAATLLGAAMGLATAQVAVSGVTVAATAGTVGRNAGNALSQGFLQTAPGLVSVAMSSVSIRISSASLGVASSARSAGRGIGSALGAGIKAGIDESVGNIAQAARDAVNTAEAAARAAADSNSPSRLFAAVGRDMGDGLALGFAESAASLISEAENVTFAASGAASMSTMGGGTNLGGVVVNQTINGDPGDWRATKRATRDGIVDGLAKSRSAIIFDVGR